jgi:hypothetical protein
MVYELKGHKRRAYAALQVSGKVVNGNVRQEERK